MGLSKFYFVHHAHQYSTVVGYLGEGLLECNTLSVFDKYGMASGVELRVPYLDHDVVEFANQLPLRYLVRQDLGINKYILRHMCLRRFGYAATDVVLRKKQGLPSAGMRLRQRFDRLCDEVLPDDYLTRHELRYCFEKKWELLMFELFREIFLVHRGNGQAVGSIFDFMQSF